MNIREMRFLDTRCVRAVYEFPGMTASVAVQAFIPQKGRATVQACPGEHSISYRHMKQIVDDISKRRGDASRIFEDTRIIIQWDTAGQNRVEYIPEKEK